MTDLLAVVEGMLACDGIVSFRGDGFLKFQLPFGRTAYDCEVRQSTATLTMRAEWVESFSERDLDRALIILARLSESASSSGSTYWHHSGRVRYVTSIDLSRVDVSLEQMAIVVETMLDPFNVKILAAEYVLDGQLSEDAAVEAYFAWDRQRIAKLICDDEVDPSLN